MYECRYIGPNMADLVSEATLAATGRACREIGGSGTRRLFEVARDATPIKSGATREAWIEHPRGEARLQAGDALPESRAAEPSRPEPPSLRRSNHEPARDQAATDVAAPAGAPAA
jgi:hypothetical protein